MTPCVVSGTKVTFGRGRNSVTGWNGIVCIIGTFTTEHYKNAPISLVISVCTAFFLPVKTAEALNVFYYNSIFRDFSKNLWAYSSCG
jgi:hypothetical protein